MVSKYVAMGVAAASVGAIIIAANGSLKAVNQSMQLQQASLAVAEFLSLTKDVETATRGYVITGDESFLEPWAESKNRFEQAQVQLAAVSSQAEPAITDVSGLIKLARTKMDWSTRVIDTRKTSSTAAMALVSSGDGKDIMDEIRTAASRITGAIQSRNDGQWHKIWRQYLPLGSAGLAGLVASIAGLLFLVARETGATVAARNLMRSVMSGSPVGLALTADGTRITSSNRAFLELFAGQGDRRLRDIPDHVRQAIMTRRQTGPADETMTHDLTIESEAGQRFIRLTTFPVVMEGGPSKGLRRYWHRSCRPYRRKTFGTQSRQRA